MTDDFASGPDPGDVGRGADPRRRGVLTRRRFLIGSGVGVGAIAILGVGGVALVDHGVLPGKQRLAEFDGACSVAVPALHLGALGTTSTGSFSSTYRQREVGYSIGYPPGYSAGDPLGLVVVLHGFSGSHTNPLSYLSLAQAAALASTGSAAGGRFALVAADGGNGYWHAHPGDDPMGMVVNELIPRCQALGLGSSASIGVLGTSMGGYGALLFGAEHPEVFSAVAAISPAVWTSYAQAEHADSGAYASAADFAAHAIVPLAPKLANTPTLVFSGTDDPFHPGVKALARALPASGTVDFRRGCHDGAFFAAHQPASLAFLAARVGPAPAVR